MENPCLSGWMMRPARQEQSRQSVAMEATSMREGEMKRRSSLYVRWAGRATQWAGTVSERLMEVLGCMTLVMTTLGA